jgi:hypothetical protein
MNARPANPVAPIVKGTVDDSLPLARRMGKGGRRPGEGMSLAGVGTVVQPIQFVFYARPHLYPLPRGEDFSNHGLGGLIDCPAIPAREFSRGWRTILLLPLVAPESDEGGWEKAGLWEIFTKERKSLRRSRL